MIISCAHMAHQFFLVSNYRYISPSNDLKFSDIPTGMAGIATVPTAGLAQILAFIGFVEVAWWPASQYDGDYGIGYFGGDIFDPAEKARKLTAEINNGRAAMMGILGNMVAEQLTGQTMYEQYAAGHFNPFNDGEGEYNMFDNHFNKRCFAIVSNTNPSFAFLTRTQVSSSKS
jgi:hypothetical protein